MSVRFPQEFLTQLLSRIDIVELIRERLSLKKVGNNYVACCPFHQEKTPSFSVNLQKQFYHCFGCGESGNAIGFLMAFDHCSFIEAVELLAQRSGLALPKGNEYQSNTHDQVIYTLLAKAAQLYRQQLKAIPEAITYLKARGLNGKICQQFKIGVSANEWDMLVKALGKTPELLHHCEQAGLLLKKTSKYYDRFRQRIMFPIRDPRGRVIGFGGRIYIDGQPKYLNSPETPVFHKSRTLYGLYELLQLHRNPPMIVVVEGYMDVVSLYQGGFTQVVATLGTATSRDHLEILFRYTDEIIFCFDGDIAGRTAAWRALQVALPLLTDGRQLKILFLPDGEDPDSYIRQQGLLLWQSLIANALTFSDFLFQHLAVDIALDTLDGKARYGALVQSYINKIPKGLLKQLLEDKLNTLVKSERRTLKKTVKLPPRFKRHSSQRMQKSLTPMRLVIALLIQQPLLAMQLDPQYILEPSLPGAKIFNELLKMIRENPQINTAIILEQWRERPGYSDVLKLAASQFALPKEALADEWQGAIMRIQDMEREKVIEHLMQQANLRGLTDEEKQQLQQLLKSV